jgi:hypothetical protein
MILETRWILGRKVKHKYGGKANQQGEVSVKGIWSGKKILETR